MNFKIFFLLSWAWLSNVTFIYKRGAMEYKQLYICWANRFMFFLWIHRALRFFSQTCSLYPFTLKDNCKMSWHSFLANPLRSDLITLHKCSLLLLSQCKFCPHSLKNYWNCTVQLAPLCTVLIISTKFVTVPFNTVSSFVYWTDYINQVCHCPV